MIKFQQLEESISITGPNRLDASALHWILFYVFGGIVVLGFLFMPLINYGILFLVFFLLFLIIRSFIRFKITLTPHLLEIKKTFLSFPYVDIIWDFEDVRYEPSGEILYFEKKNQSLSIENLDGFENNCLLIVKKEARYEIGNADDAKNIMKFLLEGLVFMNLKKS